ncbi:hypothetical protein POM88_040681 [Heracleum sosnowskyi]|uniref:20 kDa chaperonin, chloroplastic n=1 Tax=Heracleum sosnowskyi TaxID=360622 RepID=A0AAD8HCQ5_9APIA|nr:hypothetical protein POM88_040681 [Heracleum sosnowskyi]
MATSQMTASSLYARTLFFPQGNFKLSSVSCFGQFGDGFNRRTFGGLTVKAGSSATVLVAPKSWFYGVLGLPNHVLPAKQMLRIVLLAEHIWDSNVIKTPYNFCLYEYVYIALVYLFHLVLIKITTAKEKTTGGILLPSTAQPKSQGGEMVAFGEGRSVGTEKVGVPVETSSQVVYSKYVGTEVELNGSNHLIVKEDDIIGIPDGDDVKDLKPLSDRQDPH